jgi:hypothetical protein
MGNAASDQPTGQATRKAGKVRKLFEVFNELLAEKVFQEPRS